MNKATATDILKDYIQPDGSLFNLISYTSWDVGDNLICLDANFTAKELEAMAW